MEIISKIIADFILFIGDKAQTFWTNLSLINYSLPQIIADILIVSIIFYFIFLLLKGSRAVHVLIGLAIITLIYIIGRMFELVTLNWILDKFFMITLVAIPVIFQKELRMGLEKLGHTNIFTNDKHSEVLVDILVKTSLELSKAKIGALIVLKQHTPLKEYIETGIKLNADISVELLKTIFYPKTALHDGAVIIENNKIVSASSILPTTFETVPSNLGTRHKAAIGLSETTDAAIIVISEETGEISYAKDGKLIKNISDIALRRKLMKLLIDKK